jgi:ribosome-binding factor A
MPREFSRSSRLADQIQRDLSDLIRLEVRDPRVGLVTVTEVEVSRDLSHAKVYVTSLAGSDQAAQSQQALQHAAGFLRSRLAQSLKARTVPELHFVYDESVERGIRLSRLIDQAVEGAPQESGEPAGKQGD